MLRITPNADKSGQVILEAALVIISLATFAVVSMRIFSNLNLNMTTRIDHYRSSRLDAFNNAGPDPLKFLFDYTYTPTPVTGFNPGFDVAFLQDPYIFEASRLLEEENDIINVILPYKINQAYYLASQVTTTADYGKWYYYPLQYSQNGSQWYPGFPLQGSGSRGRWSDPSVQQVLQSTKYSDWRKYHWTTATWADYSGNGSDISYNNPFLMVNWTHFEYIPLVQTLVIDSRTLVNQAYTDFGKAIDSFKEALGYDPPGSYAIKDGVSLPPVPADSPVLKNPGPFNPDPQLAVYGLEDTQVNRDRLKDIKAQNLNNREQIKSTIIALQTAYAGGLKRLINGDSRMPVDLNNPDSYIVRYGLQGAFGHINDTFAKPDPNWPTYNCNRGGCWTYWQPSFTAHNAAVGGFLKSLIKYVGQVGLQTTSGSSISLDSGTKALIKDIYGKIYGNSYSAQEVGNISLDDATNAKNNADMVSVKFNVLGLSQLKPPVDELAGNLTQAIARWNDNSPPLVGEFIYTGEGREKVISVDTSIHIVTVERQLEGEEEIYVGQEGKGSITSVTSTSTAVIKLAKVDDGVPIPEMKEGDAAYTSRGWECKITSADNDAHSATIELEDKTLIIDYLELKNSSLRKAQSIIYLLYRLTADDSFANGERLIFSKYLSGQIETIYGFLPEKGALAIKISVQLAQSTLLSLTKEAVDDPQSWPELVDTHPLLNGLAERLKNRLDGALKDWDNEAKDSAKLHDADPSRFPADDGQRAIVIQDIISRIADIYNPVTLAGILNGPANQGGEGLTSDESQKILDIRAIQVKRAQGLSSARLDIRALYRVTDCHYDSGTKIVVRGAI
ncbi:MAG: hypothetical protein NTU54_08200 [Candidatus Omnitrophica bacterium]|nr:hypothetical protein [Candidatus Omnitrophota bacterium]